MNLHKVQSILQAEIRRNYALERLASDEMKPLYRETAQGMSAALHIVGEAVHANRKKN